MKASRSKKKTVKKTTKKKVVKKTTKKKVTKKNLLQKKKSLSAKKAWQKRKEREAILKEKRKEAAKKAALTRAKKKRELMRLLREKYEWDRARKKAVRRELLRVEREARKRLVKEKTGIVIPETEKVVADASGFNIETPQKLVDFATDKLEYFIKEYGYEAEVNGTVLADLSVAIESMFIEPGDKLDDLLRDLGAYLQHEMGNMFKVSIVPIFDSSADAYAIEKAGAMGRKVDRDKYWNLYNGDSAVPMWPTYHVAKQFTDFRFSLLPLIKEWTGREPKILRVVLFGGESVMRHMSSEAAVTRFVKFEK